jgi:hypothetical protein
MHKENIRTNESLNQKIKDLEEDNECAQQELFKRTTIPKHIDPIDENKNQQLIGILYDENNTLAEKKSII